MDKRNKALVYTVAEAAEMLNCSANTIYNNVRNGTIPGVIRVGKRYRFLKHIFDKFLQGQEDADPLWVFLCNLNDGANEALLNGETTAPVCNVCGEEIWRLSPPHDCQSKEE